MKCWPTHWIDAALKSLLAVRIDESSVSIDPILQGKLEIFAEEIQRSETVRCRSICEKHAENTNPPFKEHENDYLNGWLDACNECTWEIQGDEG